MEEMGSWELSDLFPSQGVVHVAKAQVSRSSVLNAESKLGLLNFKLPLYFNKNIIYLNLEFLTQICNDHNQCPCTLPVPSFHWSNALNCALL